MISLQEIVDFAKVNEIDYETDISSIIEAYKALLKAKGLEEPDNSNINTKAEKANVAIKKQMLYDWYKSYMQPSIIVGEDAAKIFYEHIDCFKEENAIILSPDITYIGSCDCVGITGRQFRAKVFKDTSGKRDKKEVFFNFYENGLIDILGSYSGLIVKREVMR